MLSQIDPVHASTFHFLKIHLNIILPSTPRFPKWSLSLRFPHQNPVYSSPPYVLHAPPISFFSILSPEQYLVCSTDHPAPYYVVFSTPLVPLSPKYSPQHPILTLSLRSSLNVSDQVSYPYRTKDSIKQAQNMNVYSLELQAAFGSTKRFRRLKQRRFTPHGSNQPQRSVTVLGVIRATA